MGLPPLAPVKPFEKGLCENFCYSLRSAFFELNLREVRSFHRLWGYRPSPLSSLLEKACAKTFVTCFARVFIVQPNRRNARRLVL